MKKDDENISYKLGKNAHNCKDKDDEDKNKIEISNKNILTSNEINDLGLKLIKQHIDKPLSFNLDNLKKIISLLNI